MTKNTLVFFSLLTTLSVSAQEVVATQGGIHTQVEVSDFTIGEVIINTGTNGTNDITQGFHQTNWNFVGQEDHSPNFEVTIFPNPTSEVLNIKTTAFEHVTYMLYDAQGKLILQDKLFTEQTPIQVIDLAPGVYTLTLKSETQNLKTFKLIKQQ
ncbi:MAG: hypothetical protein ACJA1C_000011 [Crocinitomicaceae bacterium]|jgi:hypothetical protein